MVIPVRRVQAAQINSCLCGLNAAHTAACTLRTGINLCGLPTGNNLCGLHSARVKPHKLIPVRRVQVVILRDLKPRALKVTSQPAATA